VTAAADIPVVHTPSGGYGDTFPFPVLAGCTERLPPDAPDLRGMWKVVAVEVDGEVDGAGDGAPQTAPPEHRAYRHFERIEQCGNRLVVTAGGVIHDMRCDGTEENGVHDVAEFDFTTPITVVATFEDRVHVLRPVGLPGIEVTRRLDGDDMLWSYAGNFVARLERLGSPDSAPPDA